MLGNILEMVPATIATRGNAIIAPILQWNTFCNIRICMVSSNIAMYTISKKYEKLLFSY